MPEIQVINTLNTKRRDIEAYIGSLERDLEQARSDLSAILNAIRVFSAEGPRVTAYMNLAKVFPRHVLPKLAREAVAAHPEGISTTAVAAYVINAKALDASDRHLRTAIAYKLVQLLRRLEREGKVKRLGKEKGGAVVWTIVV